MWAQIHANCAITSPELIRLFCMPADWLKNSLALVRVYVCVCVYTQIASVFLGYAVQRSLSVLVYTRDETYVYIDPFTHVSSS